MLEILKNGWVSAGIAGKIIVDHEKSDRNAMALN